MWITQALPITARQAEIRAPRFDSGRRLQLQTHHSSNSGPPSQATVRTQTLNPADNPGGSAHQPKRGIATTRNAALDKATELGSDWVASIDDDSDRGRSRSELLNRASEHKTALASKTYPFPKTKPDPSE
jgi:hypothetical protein